MNFRTITATCLLLAAGLATALAGCSPDAPRDWKTVGWPGVLKAARGTTVRFYMYGGWAHVNRWVDTWVAGELARRYAITLERVPLDASAFVNKLLAEKAAGRATGSIDLMWINGENFRNAKETGLLYGPYAQRCPNYASYVPAARVAYDFGTPTEGYETPWGTAQFVFEYDAARTPDPPASFAELREWVARHPGRFTYPQPPDFTGSAFVRQAFYATTGGFQQYLKPFDEILFGRNAPALWAYLKAVKPHLWQEGRTYPKDSATLDTLFARGEVDLNMSYHPAHAQQKILDGSYKDTVRTLVLREGSIYNTHYTAIAFNAPNAPGAMVAADFLMSPEAQLSKYDPANWGDFPVLDMALLDPAQRAAFEAVDLGAATLSSAALAAVAVPEIGTHWLEALESGWEREVLP
ncbi:MAG: ABC transporter substrate-binding protein [Desulfovibrionaceae bacterium]|jgi:putative spermidine/putrescine transport system substrate-binding protein|nr:ABC transporter substrate-binding protein [Desulfovibrionaceae bacterium]